MYVFCLLFNDAINCCWMDQYGTLAEWYWQG